MFVVPTATPVATPLVALIVAAAVLLEANVAVPVGRVAVLLSL
jgi:hypothetical protein